MRASPCLTLSLLAILQSSYGASIDPRHQLELHQKWGGEYNFGGISTFARLPHVRCLLQPDAKFDIGIVGVPYDSGTSYRPGARFGPRAIRAASARQSVSRGFNPRAGLNPYASWAHIRDCGDIPVSPYDNELALVQMTEAFYDLLAIQTLARAPPSPTASTLTPPRNHSHPIFLALGGDHSVALPHLRALHAHHGVPITVVHFDAHLDTSDPRTAADTPWGPSPSTEFNHGSVFFLAGAEGLISDSSNVHLGLRARLGGAGWADYDADAERSWKRLEADTIDDLGPAALAEQVVGIVGRESPVYISVDIDVLDPSVAPGTGTPEPGGWSMRELIKVLRGLEGLNIVGADVVEVSPAYEGGGGEGTALAASQVAFEILTSLVGRGRGGDRGVGTRSGVGVNGGDGEGDKGSEGEERRDEL